MKPKLILALLTLLPFACKEDNAGNDVELPGPPVITSIEPSTGQYNTEVTINGSHFEPNLSDNIVTVNEKVADVISATAKQLVVKVPRRAGTGKVKVENNISATEGPQFSFTYTSVVSNFSGTGTSGFNDASASAAQYNQPAGLRIGPDGFIYVSDRLNNRIRFLYLSGDAVTYSGSTPGFNNGHISLATYSGPNGIAWDSNGDLYVAELGNNLVRKIESGFSVTFYAGTGAAGFTNGPAASAEFRSPESVAVDANHNVYVTDYDNHAIRKITPAGAVSTFAGNGALGFQDGTGIAVQFNSPVGIDIDSEGNLYVADSGNNRIRKITPAGVVSTVAGSGVEGFTAGNALTSKLFNPRDVAVDDDGNIYIADMANHAVRLLLKSGQLVTLAGTGTSGSQNGDGVVATFNSPIALDVDGEGNVYIADRLNHKIRKMVVN